MWDNIQQLMQSIFSPTMDNGGATNKEGKNVRVNTPFNGLPNPPEMPPWITQFMASPFNQSAEAQEDQSPHEEKHRQSGHSSFDHIEKLGRQWPFTTLQDNPFAIFQHFQEQGKPSVEGKTLGQGKPSGGHHGPSFAKGRPRRRPTRPF